MISKNWSTRLWVIFVMFTGIANRISANKTLENLMPKLGNNQHVIIPEAENDENIQAIQTKSRNATHPAANYHPLMQIIYDEISKNNHKKWAKLTASEALIKGIEPAKVQQKVNGTAFIEFNIRKSYDFTKTWHSMLALPITCIANKCVSPKNFKMLLQTVSAGLCEATLNSYPYHSYTLLDLTPCLHQLPRIETFQPDSFNVTLFWEDTSIIVIGRPLLVLYFNASASGNHKHVNMPTYQQLLKRGRRSTHHNGLAIPNIYKNNIQQQSTVQLEHCVLHKWQVTIEDLQWGSWVIAPAEFTLNYCRGSCSLPFIGIFGNASSNAIIRSMLLANRPKPKHQIANVNIPEPHCVPTQMRHTNYMYIENAEIVIGKLENIVAEQCGCQ